MNDMNFTLLEKGSYSKKLFFRTLTIGLGALALLFGLWVVSVFKYSLSVEAEGSSFSLVVPVLIPELILKIEEEKPQVKLKYSLKQQVSIARNRVTPIEQSLNVIPQKIDTSTKNVLEIPKGVVGKLSYVDNFSTDDNLRDSQTGEANGTENEPFGKVSPIEEAIPPPMHLKSFEAIKVPSTPVKQSTGTTMGRLLNIVKPVMPKTAIALSLKGQQVFVDIAIDEKGNVVSITNVKGHPLLQAVAKQAALTAKFKPTLLSGEPIKTFGTIVFNFN